MELPFAGKVKFFVYIVESPSAVDLYHRRHESDLLRRVLELESIPSVARLAISREALFAALTVGIAEEMKEFENRIPILHISAHGNAQGIGLSNGDTVSWNDLRTLLVPINKALGAMLLVAMSCCEGYSGIRMAMTEDPSEEYPYAAIVGSPESPTWSDTSVAYSTFYHLIGKGAYLADAVNAMCVASGDKTFGMQMAKEIRKGYIEYLQTLDPVQVQQDLVAASEEIQRDQPEEMAKAVSLEGGSDT